MEMWLIAFQHPYLWENWMFEVAGTTYDELFAFGYGGY